MSDFVAGSLVTLLTGVLTTLIGNRHALQKAEVDHANQRALAAEAAKVERERLDIQHARARAWQMFEHDERVVASVVEAVEQFRAIYLAHLRQVEHRLLGVQNPPTSDLTSVRIPWASLQSAVGLHAPDLKSRVVALLEVRSATSSAISYSALGPEVANMNAQLALDTIRAGMDKVNEIADAAVDTLSDRLQTRRHEVQSV